MNRTERINKAIDEHFKSNRGNWKAEGYANPELKDHLCISYNPMRYTGKGFIQPRHIALFILRTEKDVNYITYGAWIFTRTTLRAAGFKI